MEKGGAAGSMLQRLSDIAHMDLLTRLLAAGCLLAVLAGCGEGTEDAVSAKRSVAPLSTKTAPVSLMTTSLSEKTVTEAIDGTGTISAARTSGIGPIVEGLLEEIYVRVGDRVDKGDPLFKIRQDQLLIQERELKNALQLAEAETERAGREIKRIRKLRETGVVSGAHFDRALAEEKTASARLGMAQAALDRVSQHIIDSIPRAPYRGVITQRFKDEGVYLSNRLSGLSNSAVVELQQIDIVVAVVSVPEKYLTDIGVGTPAKLFIDGIAQAYDTQIYVINDAVNIESRAIEVRLVVKNDDYAIKPGLFVRVEISPAPRTVRLIERRALRGPSNEPYVYVHGAGIAERRPVRFRDFDATHVEVTGGLTDRDEILIGPNLPRLRDGMRVIVEAGHVAG